MGLVGLGEGSVARSRLGLRGSALRWGGRGREAPHRPGEQPEEEV